MPIATYSPVKSTQAYPLGELRANGMILVLRRLQKLSPRMAFTYHVHCAALPVVRLIGVNVSGLEM